MKIDELIDYLKTYKEQGCTEVTGMLFAEGNWKSLIFRVEDNYVFTQEVYK